MAEINWQEFEASTFDSARQSDRPLILVITKPWCQHSKKLLKTTFEDSAVLEVVNESFIALKVDAERRPDVNERYGTGSWPTIAYLTPEGELISNDGFLESEQLLDRLQKVLGYLKNHREEIEDGLRSLWTQKSGSSDVKGVSGKLNMRITEDVIDAIYDKFDHRYGGWGESSKFPHPEAIDFALVQVAKKDDPRMREVVTTTLDKMMEGAIHDPIDGGFFRFSKTPDWRSPNFEKVLDANALRLRCYLEAYQLFDNPAYRKVSEGICNWMLEFMLDPETGAFFGNQDADADYYLLNREDRRGRNRPAVDKTIYANWNAMAVSALLKASVVLENAELRERAMSSMEFLLGNLYDERDGVYHYWDGTYHLPGMLSDQAYMIRALIDTAQHTGNSDFLLPAEKLAELAIERQKAPGGGFFDILADPHEVGSMRRRNRSILENSAMAEALVRQSFLSHRHEFHDEAVRTLEAFTGDYKEYGYYVAGYARAIDLIFYEPLVIMIVGDRKTAEADALRKAALAPYVPSRIVQMLDPVHDPILLGRSGLKAEDRPYVQVSLGHEAKATLHTPEELLAKISELEQERR
ncbi:MAG: thioredoxin domain-containing protein [Planctomycetota bacterium]|jgi:uncharacterized protein YyaL (SSP411 family)